MTDVHQSDYCAMYDLCGANDHGNLPCPENKPSEEVDDALAAKLSQYCPYLWNDIRPRRRACCNLDALESTYAAAERGFSFFGGCPACLNQATFTDVKQTQIDPVTSKTTVKEVHFHLSEAFKQTFFDSCKEVKLSTTNIPVLSFMGNPTTPDEYLGFLGLSYESGGEAPYSLLFPSEDQTPADMTPYNQTLPDCGSPGFECSCADCSTADYCKTIGGDKKVERKERKDDSDSGLRKYEYGVLAAGIVALILVALLVYCSPLERQMHEIAPLEHVSENSYEPVSDGNEFCAVLLEGESIAYPTVERWLRSRFYVLGVFVARRPYFTIVVSLFTIGLLSLGNINYQLETRPQELWTPKGSRSVKERTKYEAAFGPFYRIENLILSTRPSTPSPQTSANGLPSIVTHENVNLVFRIHDIMDSIEVQVEDDKNSYIAKLQDVCYKPLGVCVVESIAQYWQLERSRWESFFEGQLESDYDSITRASADKCFKQWPTLCRSNFQSPIDPKIVLGGFPFNTSAEYLVNDTTAFSMTFLLDSSKENLKAAMAWEKAYLDASNTIVKSLAQDAELDIGFMAERSNEDEVDRETYMDAWTVVCSYLVMFAYIAASLTFLTKRHPDTTSNVLILSHVVLGLEGVTIVVLSVFGAFGLLSLIDMAVSLIVLEVLPFLVLAVGVDNMFILANELRSLEPGLPLSLRLGKAMAEVGPSITCAGLSEGLAFGLAALAPIPSSRSFSLCACFAILLDFCLQCTLFASFLVLDTVRRESNRVDCMPCIQLKDNQNSEEPEYVVSETGTPPQASQEPIPENPLQRAINKNYVPFLLSNDRKIVRWIVLSLTVAGFATSCVLMGRMERGLPQEVALPHDSYLQDYHTRAVPQTRMGAPVMYVVENMNVSQASNDVAKICGIAGCRHDSFVSQIDLAATVGAYHTASPVASWIDEFLMWFRTPTCCRTRGNTLEHCPYEDTDPDCIPCAMSLAEEQNIYQKHLPGFMASIPSQLCPRGGRGAYEDTIEHAEHNSSDVVGLDQQLIRTSAFRTYSDVLLTQNAYIDALEETQEFADSLKESTGLEVYAYSIFHIYFQQYLNIVELATLMISVSIAAVFVVCWVLLSSFRTSLIVIVCVLMTVIDLIGASYISDVGLNGVSVVNLTMSVGIAVEFCVHLAHAFLIVPGSKVGRVAAAFQGVGISVISGIALTKFLGVVVLGFAKTKLFQLYYFRMYMALVLLGAWHGLVVLPILLALFGPPSPVTQTTRPTNNNAYTRLGQENAPSSKPHYVSLSNDDE